MAKPNKIFKSYEVFQAWKIYKTILNFFRNIFNLLSKSVLRTFHGKIRDAQQEYNIKHQFNVECICAWYMPCFCCEFLKTCLDIDHNVLRENVLLSLLHRELGSWASNRPYRYLFGPKTKIVFTGTLSSITVVVVAVTVTRYPLHWWYTRSRVPLSLSLA